MGKKLASAKCVPGKDSSNIFLRQLRPQESFHACKCHMANGLLSLRPLDKENNGWFSNASTGRASHATVGTISSLAAYFPQKATRGTLKCSELLPYYNAPLLETTQVKHFTKKGLPWITVNPFFVYVFLKKIHWSPFEYSTFNIKKIEK